MIDDQAVQLRIIPLPDDSSFTDRQRRVRDDRTLDQFPEVRQRIDPGMDLLHERRFAFPEKGEDLGQDQKRRPERGEVAAIGQSHGNPAAQALQVINGLKTAAEGFPKEMLLADLGNGRQPLPDQDRIAERIVEPAAEPPPPHGGHCLIEDVKKRSRLFPLGNRREEFEISLGDLVHDQMGAAFIPGQVVDVRKGVLLRLGHIGEDRAGRSRRRRTAFDGPVPRAFPAEYAP